MSGLSEIPRASPTPPDSSPAAPIPDCINKDRGPQPEDSAKTTTSVSSVRVLPPVIPVSATYQVSSDSTSNFALIFRGACDEYKKFTGHDLYTHPFAKEVASCNSPDSILDVLRRHAETFIKYSRNHEKLISLLNPIVNVLFIFSATLGEGVGLVRISSIPSASLWLNIVSLAMFSREDDICWHWCPSLGRFHDFPIRIPVTIISGDERCSRFLR